PTLPRRQLGIDLNLEGVELAHISFDGRVVYRNPFPGARFSDDDLAVAAILRDTGRWARGEAPEPYPLAEGCQDHLLGLAVEEAARTGTPVTTRWENWANRPRSTPAPLPWTPGESGKALGCSAYSVESFGAVVVASGVAAHEASRRSASSDGEP